ncbi:MAG: hypothetical protein MI757_11150 [Pirellulales bacterium]|nr:hypothetical protein [Pirellulales bacterium]
MSRIGIVTCVELPEPDPDQQLLLDALASTGVHASLIAWDDPNANPAAYDLCVFRSCWNYHWHFDAFMDWIERAEQCTRLVNSAKVTRWNLHKRYLRQLEDASVPIIPTTWFGRGSSADLATAMQEHDWDDVVIKPAISAGSYRTHRVHVDNVAAGQDILSGQVRDHDTMVQRYMRSVEEPGERALIWIDGEVTHAVVKSPRFADGVEQVSDAVAPTDADREIARAALAIIDDDLVYARVDVVEDQDKNLVVSELELIEPSLFFLQCPKALERFVAAIVSMV